MDKMPIREVDERILEMQAKGESYKDFASKAQQTKKAMVMAGDGSGVWNVWSLIPSKSPQWLWDMVRTSDDGNPLDDWGLLFINDALSIMGSDVRFDVNGKPTSHLIYYRTQLQSYTDDEKLMKWANSTKERGNLVAVELQNGAGSVIGASRDAFYGERLITFYKVFMAVAGSELDYEQVPSNPVYDNNVMKMDDKD